MAEDGGYLVPAKAAEELLAHSRQGMDELAAYILALDAAHHVLYPPLTRRQRFGIWRSDLRWRVHDRLFPDCHRDDDW